MKPEEVEEQEAFIGTDIKPVQEEPWSPELQIFLMQSIDITSITALGDTTLLAGVGIGITWAAICMKCVISGLNQGSLTIYSQAFGARNTRTVGLCLQRAIILRVAGSIFQFLLLGMAYPILKLFQVSDTNATYATLYCQYTMLNVIPYIAFDTFKVFLASHQIFYPLMFIQIAGVGIHWFVCRYLVITLDLEVAGVAIANTITYSLLALSNILYSFYDERTRPSLFAFSKESLRKLGSQFKIEFFIASFLYLETISAQVLTLLGASYSTEQITAQVVISTIFSIGSVSITGLDMVLCTYIAAFMGKKDVAAVKKSITYGMIISVAYGCLEVACLLIWRKQIMGIYATDDTVIEIGATIIIVYAIFIPIDYARGVLVATAKCVGKEKLGSIIYLISYYGVGLSMAFLFGTELGWYDKGLWFGTGIGLTTMLILLSILLLRTDWSKQVAQIEQRISYLDNKISTLGESL